MNQQQLRDEIKLHLTGEMLELEIEDSTIDKVINSALREVQRYLTTTNIITIPFKECIELSSIKDPVTDRPIKVNSVVRVYRTKGYTSTDNQSTDPMYLSMWQMAGGINNICAISNFTENFGAFNTAMQIRNTLSTDLAFRYDKPTERLYINTSLGTPSDITIEYIPRIDTVEEVTADYWIDILTRMSIAMTKVLVGRIRTRYIQSNSLWTQDGSVILDEGNNELKELREHLTGNADLFVPVD